MAGCEQAGAIHCFKGLGRAVAGPIIHASEAAGPSGHATAAHRLPV
jgi:hypothetical protein